MTTVRFDHTATSLPNGKVLITGGRDDSGTLFSAELYDPATGTWSPTGALNTERENHTATLLLNGQVVVAGGCQLQEKITRLHRCRTGRYWSRVAITGPASLWTAQSCTMSGPVSGLQPAR